MTWEEAVSELRELAKETEDFTIRLQTLASQIQRMSRDAERIDKEKTDDKAHVQAG